MATATASSSLKTKRSRIIRILLYILFVIVGIVGIGLLGAYVWFRSTERAAMPTVEGTVRVVGLSAPVQVIRDHQGVPHITAASMTDLFLAQGYVTAQDRLWQMDTTRRYAAGELSGAFGGGMIETDKSQRLLGFRQLAHQQYAMMSVRDRSYFDAYARGVNAFIAEHQHALPMEFRILRYSPRPWTPEDSLLAVASLSESLTHGYISELRHEAVAAKVGSQLAADLYVNVSPDDVPPQVQGQPGTAQLSRFQEATPDLYWQESTLPAADREMLKYLKLPLNTSSSDGSPYPIGSNNWVVSGNRTASGKPLLSNDMHLQIQIPDIWYEAHLTSRDFDVAGVSLPGVPTIVVGHNRTVAWGFTAVQADVEDLYIETFNNEGLYLTPKGWEQPQIRQEKIAIKGGTDISMDIVITRHGPIMTDVIKGESRRISMRSTMLTPEALRFPFFNINSAQGLEEFRKAILQVAVPVNTVYADVFGHTGYWATGLYPKRPNGWGGALPVNGSDNQHEWIGTLDPSQLPAFENADILATANSRITPDGFPDTLSNKWVAPLRLNRILQLLHQDKKLTREDMLVIQLDIYSRFDQYVAERLVYGIDHSIKVNARTRAAAELLRKWNGRIEADSAAAAIESTAQKRLRRLLLESKLGNNYDLYSSPMEAVWLENILKLQPQHWLPNGYSNWNDVFNDAVDFALKEWNAPRNLSRWKYGEVFPLGFQHLVFGSIPGLDRISGPGRLPQSGGFYTVKSAWFSGGPSERFTADLSDLDQSTLNIVHGQSGNLGDPHYMDQWGAWYNGATFNLPFKPESVAKAKEHELRLVP